VSGEARRLVAIVGPTASGKSDVAAAVARRLPVEIVSCDSMQVYAGMAVVTQAPPPGSAHLVSFLDPSEEYNAALFRKDASRIAAEISSRGHLPLVTGGTGLYLRALLDGLFEEGAAKDQALRDRLVAEAAVSGAPALHARLAVLDPARAGRVHPNDLRRIVRALEVCELTRRPMSEQEPRRSGLRTEYACRIFLLERSREDLYARIERRVERMTGEGLLDEVRRLAGRPLGKTAATALGIPEMRAHLEGKITLEEAAALLKKNSRHYAKRQLSWFRHEKGVEPVLVGAAETAEETAEKIIGALSA